MDSIPSTMSPCPYSGRFSAVRRGRAHTLRIGARPACRLQPCRPRMQGVFRSELHRAKDVAHSLRGHRSPGHLRVPPPGSRVMLETFSDPRLLRCVCERETRASLSSDPGRCSRELRRRRSDYGHTRRGYLLPVDADPDSAEINGYPIDLLYANLGKLDAAKSVRVFLDACFSATATGGCWCARPRRYTYRRGCRRHREASSRCSRRLQARRWRRVRRGAEALEARARREVETRWA